MEHRSKQKLQKQKQKKLVIKNNLTAIISIQPF